MREAELTVSGTGRRPSARIGARQAGQAHSKVRRPGRGPRELRGFGENPARRASPWSMDRELKPTTQTTQIRA